MISIESGVVEKIIWSRGKIQCLEIKIAGKKEKAFNYPEFTGEALPGDLVMLNTTAVKLNLGSGGYHFVMANYRIKEKDLNPGGHILKLRYTPLQCKVLTYEEILAQNNKSLAWSKYEGLRGIPVVLGELHSMVAPFVITLKKINPALKIAYIMSDSASLPIYLSDTIFQLKKDSFLEGTVTFGHAFGGDLETVNIYTALMAAREELKADVILLTPGPGVVGTFTRYGFSGLEQGGHIDIVNKMQGIAVVIPRISFNDGRLRHRGLSHHTLTVLSEIASQRAFLPLPVLDKEKMRLILKQLKTSNLIGKHKIIFIKNNKILKWSLKGKYNFQTMGRGLKEDPAFFFAVKAAAIFTEKIFRKR